MPDALTRACTHLGCGGTQPCPEHTRQRDERRGTANERGYSRLWQRISKAFLKRNPLCGMRDDQQPPVMSECRAQQRITPANVVDHVVPHRGNQRLFWNQRNWQALCFTCHNRKTQSGA